MKKKSPANLAGSVRQRLLNVSSKTGADPHFVWTRFATERLLYRLSRSQYKDQFVLKGAMLFSVWTNQPYRPTHDLDLLGFGEPSDKRIVNIFGELCVAPVEPDGLVFDANSVKVEPIREEQAYIVLHRSVKHPRIRWCDRVFWVWLSRIPTIPPLCGPPGRLPKPSAIHERLPDARENCADRRRFLSL